MSRPVALASVVLLLLAFPVEAQVFTLNTTDIPQVLTDQRYSEQVDFADVDLDGDFDAALSRGGDLGNLLDRLWINQGGLQYRSCPRARPRRTKPCYIGRPNRYSPERSHPCRHLSGMSRRLGTHQGRRR